MMLHRPEGVVDLKPGKTVQVYYLRLLLADGRESLVWLRAAKGLEFIHLLHLRRSLFPLLPALRGRKVPIG